MRSLHGKLTANYTDLVAYVRVEMVIHSVWSHRLQFCHPVVFPLFQELPNGLFCHVALFYLLNQYVAGVFVVVMTR